MKARATTALVGAALVGTLLVACEQTTPVAGPAGPAGNTAITTRVFTIQSADFSFSADGQIATVLWSMPEVTQETFDNGIVVAHWRYRRSHDSWRSLPDVFQWDDLVVATTMFVYSPGFVGLQIDSPDAIGTAAVAANLEGGSQLRVVVVPPR